jgi:hypothetical protein
LPGDRVGARFGADCSAHHLAIGCRAAGNAWLIPLGVFSRRTNYAMWIYPPNQWVRHARYDDFIEISDISKSIYTSRRNAPEP